MASVLGLASIILVGLAANNPTPGVFVELDFAQGPVSGAGGVRGAILLANKTAAGSATADTVVYGPDTQTPCQTENDVIALFGPGSQMHCDFLRWTKVAGSGSNIPLYFCAVAESGGAQATATLTITNAATSNGNHRFWCRDEFVDTGITSGDSVTTIAAAISANINNKTAWPITASPSAGVITITAKNHGPEGNWVRVQALVSAPNGAVIATTTSLTANGFLSGGTTPDNVTNALATIAAQRFYYIVVADSDATNIGRVVTQVNSQALPTTGIRQRVIAGSMDTQANANTVAISLNAARDELVWGNAADLTPSELAANNAALYATLELGAPTGVARMNFSKFPANDTDKSLWVIPAGRNGVAGAPTAAQIQSCLLNGVTPITVLPGGQTQLVKRITTRSLNGSTSDYRTRDAHKVTVCDYWCDDAAAILQNQFGGKVIVPDPVIGQPPPGPLTVSPSQVRSAIRGLTTRYGNASQWSFPPALAAPPNSNPADVINANTIVQQETSPRTRISILAPLSPVDLADQFALLAQQVG